MLCSLAEHEQMVTLPVKVNELFCETMDAINLSELGLYEIEPVPEPVVPALVARHKNTNEPPGNLDSSQSSTSTYKG